MMTRAFGFLALIVTAVLAVAMLTGSLAGSVHILSASANGGQSTMSPMAVGYAALGLMMGLGLASLARFSWSELPRLAHRWLQAQRRTFGLMVIAFALSGVLLFY